MTSQYLLRSMQTFLSCGEPSMKAALHEQKHNSKCKTDSISRQFDSVCEHAVMDVEVYPYMYICPCTPKLNCPPLAPFCAYKTTLKRIICSWIIRFKF